MVSAPAPMADPIFGPRCYNGIERGPGGSAGEGERGGRKCSSKGERGGQ